MYMLIVTVGDVASRTLRMRSSEPAERRCSMQSRRPTVPSWRAAASLVVHRASTSCRPAAERRRHDLAPAVASRPAALLTSAAPAAVGRTRRIASVSMLSVTSTRGTAPAWELGVTARLAADGLSVPSTTTQQPHSHFNLYFTSAVFTRIWGSKLRICLEWYSTYFKSYKL